MKCYQNINKIFHSFHISTSSPPACHLCHVGKTALIGPPVFERVIAPGDGDFWEISSWACPLSCIWVILLENFIEHVGQWRCAWLICSTALFVTREMRSRTQMQRLSGFFNNKIKERTKTTPKVKNKQAGRHKTGAQSTWNTHVTYDTWKTTDQHRTADTRRTI